MSEQEWIGGFVRPPAAASVFALLLILTSLASGREWTDSSGRFRIQAELEQIDGDDVVLRKEDGTAVRLPVARLSPVDRNFVAAQRRSLHTRRPDAVRSDSRGSETPFAVLPSGRPVTGPDVAGIGAFDATVDAFMTRIECAAATFALTNNGRFVYARGYGYSDAQGRTPTLAGTPMRIASNSKPFTAALIWQLIGERKLRPETPVFAYLGISPYNGRVGDPRLARVTVTHLLEHRGGWDHALTFDPMYSLETMARSMGVSQVASSLQITQYMLAQPLQFAPGERRAYSNFGYMILGSIVEKATGKPYLQALQQRIAKPLRIDVQGSATLPAQRNGLEVFYPREAGIPMEIRYPCGGLIASAPAICIFLQHYWINGERRQPSQSRNYRHFGSLPNCTTCLMEQRGDGVNYAVVLNGRRNDSFQADNDLLRESLTRIIDEWQRKGRR